MGRHLHPWGTQERGAVFFFFLPQVPLLPSFKPYFPSGPSAHFWVPQQALDALWVRTRYARDLEPQKVLSSTGNPYPPFHSHAIFFFQSGLNLFEA